MNLYLFKAKYLTVFCCLLLMQTTLLAQSTIRIVIKNKGITVRKALEEVESQSKLSIAYNQSQLSTKQLLSLNIDNQPLDTALETILKGTGFTYKLSDKYILIIPGQKSVQAQTVKEIRGRVVDEHAEPLIGVSISLQGTSLGTITDLDGKFSLQASANSVLKVSYIGYATQQIVVLAKDFYQIVLKQDAEILDEVVVTALGIKREAKALSYNVQEMKAADLTTVKNASVVNSLSGKIAGITINQSASGIGGSTRVVMRGTKSLFGENNALYVLDGIPLQGLRSKQSDNYYESAEMGDSDGISNLNSDDIETMSVLTGASAAALYGNRGANGVILITTKKGLVGKPHITYSNNTTFMSPFVTPEFQNTYGTRDGEFKSWGEKMSQASSYDPLDFFQTGFSTMNSVGISTGSETHQAHVSLGAVNSEGIIPNDQFERYNFSYRGSSQLIKNVLEMDMSLYYTKQKNQNGHGSGLYYNPLVPVYLFPPGDDFSKYTVYEHMGDRNFKTQYWPYGGQSVGMQNPYWIVNRNMSNTTIDRYMLTGSIKWNVTSWLNVIGRARFDRAGTSFERKLYASTDGLYCKEKGHYIHQESANQSLYLDFLANVDKTFQEDYRLLVNIGGSYFDERYSMIGYQGNLLQVPNFFHFDNINKAELQQAVPKQSSSRQQTQAFYGKAELGYKNFLYLDVTGRIDFFSSLKGTDQSYVFYPSVGLSAVLTEVIPLPRHIFSFWKVRGSYAQVGNPPNPYLTGNYVVLDNGAITTNGFVAATHLKPEMTKSFEVGTDIRLFDNRLSLSATYYNSNTYNQLFKYELPLSTGYKYAYENAGKVNNWGLELSAGLNQKLGLVEWESNLIYSLNRNEIKELLPEFVTDRVTNEVVKSPTDFVVSTAESYRMILKEGGTMSDIYATHLKHDGNGYLYVNPRTGNIEADVINYEKVGSAAPKYNLGFQNSFSYKGLNLSFLLQARVGGEVVSATQALMDQFGTSKSSAIARDNGGVLVNQGRLSALSYYDVVASGNTGLLGHYVYSATNVRLKELSLSYNLPSKWFRDKLNLTLSLTGQNLLMLYCKAPFDPELTSNTNTYYQGFDYFMQPSLRSLGFGVKVSF